MDRRLPRPPTFLQAGPVGDPAHVVARLCRLHQLYRSSAFGPPTAVGLCFLLSGKSTMQPIESNQQLPPFPAFPCTTRYVQVGSVADALTRVFRSVDASEAISLIIGPPGTGKSLLCGLLALQYRETHDVVVLGGTRLADGNALMRQLLHHLPIDQDTFRDGDPHLALVDYLESDRSAKDGLLIIIDEAQSLPKEVLEAIRMVTNIMSVGVPRVTAIVCGGAQLDNLLVEPSLESFTQRVATRCYLHPLNGAETATYIREIIRQCGADPDATINDEAVAQIHHACSGVPRLINQLMTQSIDCAEEAEKNLITDEIITLAWSQLQQLPSPMIEEPSIKGESIEIEFGELDERPSDDLDLTVLSLVDGGFEVERKDAMEASDPPPQPPSMGLGLEDILLEPEDGEWLASNLEDGEFDHATPSEMDCPTQVTQTNPELLFGNFDNEEQIKLGMGVSERSTNSDPQPTDLEKALHEEVIGLNDCLQDLLGQPLSCDSMIDACESLDDESFELPARSLTPNETPGSESSEHYPRIIPSGAEESNQPIGSASVEPSTVNAQDSLQRDAPEETPDMMTSSSESVLWIEGHEIPLKPLPQRRDDSDLLVIEDEVELQRIDVANQNDSSEQAISVDFQTMLSRMRSGGKSQRSS